MVVGLLVVVPLVLTGGYNTIGEPFGELSIDPLTPVGLVMWFDAARPDLADAVGEKWGRRLFKMSPIHHHFELLNWAQVTIVMRFWIIAGLCVAAVEGAAEYAAFVAALSPFGRRSPDDRRIVARNPLSNLAGLAVAPGETLWGIAMANNLPTSAVAATRPITPRSTCRRVAFP